MSERVIELFRAMSAEKLEEELQRTAVQAAVGPLPKDDVQHLIQVLTSQPLVLASLVDLVRATEPLDGQIPHVLTLLASASPAGWRVLVDKTALVQHRRHQLEPIHPMPVTHVRVHIFPHGGVNRLRFFGYAVGEFLSDGKAEVAA